MEKALEPNTVRDRGTLRHEGRLALNVGDIFQRSVIVVMVTE